jgi:hypothetical protein
VHGNQEPLGDEALRQPEQKQLARVRALLAKAESTTYDAEAEALTAKAQELISRYALQRLLDRVSAGTVGSSTAVATRRFTLDPPYVAAKASLVGAVGRTNRVRTVLFEGAGYCSMVGDPGDLDATELLATSLLVQAHAAMVRHGRQCDGWGTSRTRSFRQSFLYAFASRIGQRLQEAGRAAAAELDPADRLLPVVRAVEAAVEAEFRRQFPAVRTRTTTVSNRAGWAAGTAAADLANLNAHGEVPRRAG